MTSEDQSNSELSGRHSVFLVLHSVPESRGEVDASSIQSNRTSEERHPSPPPKVSLSTQG